MRENLGKPAVTVGKLFLRAIQFRSVQLGEREPGKASSDGGEALGSGSQGSHPPAVTDYTSDSIFRICEKCELELVPPRCLPALTFYDSISQSIFTRVSHLQGLPWWLSGKESTCQHRRHGFNPGSGRYPGEENGNSLQYSCLGNPMD